MIHSHYAQCAGKVRYATKRIAKAAARHYETVWGGGRIEHYECPHCGPGIYHIGHARFKRAP